jgi:hypothetical protein
MELQLRVARTTVDIDLTLRASLSLRPEEAPATATVLEMLQEAASLDLGDRVRRASGFRLKAFRTRAPYSIPFHSDHQGRASEKVLA